MAVKILPPSQIICSLERIICEGASKRSAVALFEKLFDVKCDNFLDKHRYLRREIDLHIE